MNARSLYNGNAGPLASEHFLAAGAVCRIETNSELILAAARQSFVPIANPLSAAGMSIRLCVDPAACSRPPWPRAHFRGLDHLVIAAFDSENTVLADLRRRRATGRFSPAMAASADYLRRVIFPTLFGIFTDTIPVTPLHCACVENEGRGLLLTGASGSGKSTLSLSLARNGFGFLSDEWTYFTWRAGRLLAWGLSSAPLKLLSDAPRHFPELEPVQPGISSNGEKAYEIEPESVFGVRRSVCAEPEWLIFLERQAVPGFSVSRVSPLEAEAQFEEYLAYFATHGLWEGKDLAVKTIQSLSQISCWRLRYGGQPAPVAQALAEFLQSTSEKELQREPSRGRSGQNMTAPDMLRRATPTPFAAHLHIMGRTVRLETNSAALVRYFRSQLESYGGARSSRPDFLWRLVSEPDAEFEARWPEMAGFSDASLSLVNFGQRSFIAVDQHARKAVGFLEERLTRDKPRFVRILLAALITLTASALGPRAASAARAAWELGRPSLSRHPGDV